MPADLNWATPPPDSLGLAESEVHVWRCDLLVPAAALARFRQTLSHDERARAGRLVREALRARWSAARGWLRSILARYVARAPQELRFVSTAHGRPELAAPVLAPPLRFNQSHSHDLSLIAVTRGRDIGVDVEFIRPNLSAGEIAGRFFAPRESAALRALSPAQQTRAFFECWTRKEAFVKARGVGLSFPLSRFAVGFGPREPCALWHVEGEPAAANEWRLEDLAAGPGYAGALAVAGRDWTLCRWQGQIGVAASGGTGHAPGL